MRIVAIALAASLCGGCFVMDELDDSRGMLDAAGGAAEREQPARAEPAEPEGPSLLTRLERWWKRLDFSLPRFSSSSASPSAPRDPSDVMVSCRVGNATLFTRRSTCRARGGHETVVALDEEE